MPFRRATITNWRSRRVSTWARIVRVGHIQANEATTSAIMLTLTAPRSVVAITTKKSKPGTVNKTSAAPLIKVSTQPPK